MNLEDLSRMSEAELRAKANEHLETRVEVIEGGQITSTPDLGAAQFFIDEIERRAGEAERKRQRWITTRDLILELVVILLIGAELYYGIRGGNEQLAVLGRLNTSAGQQLDLLKKMNTNAEQTAAILRNLSGEQERALTAQQQTLQMTTQMNGALQTQLGLTFVPEITLIYDEQMKSLIFQNFGKANVMMWGTKLEPEDRLMVPEPRIIIPSSGYKFSSIEDTLKVLSQQIPKGGSKQVRYDVYLKNAKDKKYTASYFLIFVWKGDTLSLNVQMIGIKPEEW